MNSAWNPLVSVDGARDLDDVRGPGATERGSASPVDIYVDFSNIFYGARAHAEQIGENPAAMRLQASSLYQTLAAGRLVRTAFMVANARTPEAVLHHFREWFEVRLAEPGAISGREVAADELLQNRIFFDLMWERAPSVLVLATGDGAGMRIGTGFGRVLTRARQTGQGVEVAAFRENVNPILIRFTQLSRGAFVDLGEHYRSVTFLDGRLRSAEPVNLRHRPTAEPHPWEDGELDRIFAPDLPSDGIGSEVEK